MAKAPEETPEATQRRTLVRNPEAVAIDKISELLDGLEPRACGRVVAWVSDVYGPTKAEPVTS